MRKTGELQIRSQEKEILMIFATLNYISAWKQKNVEPAAAEEWPQMLHNHIRPISLLPLLKSIYIPGAMASPHSPKEPEG